jgi:hypothetical protein
MPTLNQMIYNIRNVADGGIGSRAQKVSNRQIAFWIDAWRKKLIDQDLAQRGFLDPTWETDFGCVSLETVDAADCKKHKWGEDVKKATLPVLFSTRVAGVNTLTFVGLLDKRTRIPIDLGGYGELDDYVMYQPKAITKAKLIGNIIYVFGWNDNNADLDIIDDSNLCAINVRGVPAEVMDYCDWDKDQYPIPPHLEELLYQNVLQFEMGLVRQTQPDNKNDGVSQEAA